MTWKPSDRRVPATFPDQPPSIAFVAEAPGDEEVWKGEPMVGRAGSMFNSLMRQANIERAEVMITNVLDFKLKDNDLKCITVPRSKVLDYDGPFNEWVRRPVIKGGYLPPEIAVPQLLRLKAELVMADPFIIGALGGLAAWALLGVPGHGVIKKIRGTVAYSILVQAKVIPTMHPAYLFRQYGHRPLVWSDFLKIKRESDFEELRLAEQNIFIPTMPIQIQDWFHKHQGLLACDIETSHGMIDCIGFGTATEAICIPIFDNKTGEPYWDHVDFETAARLYIAHVLTHPYKWEFIFQNGSYDVQWIWEKWRIKVRGYAHDTRLLHHAVWPELPKDLATMAALHTDMPQWKPLRGKGLKRDE